MDITGLDLAAMVVAGDMIIVVNDRALVVIGTTTSELHMRDDVRGWYCAGSRPRNAESGRVASLNHIVEGAAAWVEQVQAMELLPDWLRERTTFAYRSGGSMFRAMLLKADGSIALSTTWLATAEAAARSLEQIAPIEEASDLLVEEIERGGRRYD